MELRRRFGRDQARLCQYMLVVQIDGRVAALAGGIYIDHFDVIANGTGLQILFPPDIYDGLVDAYRFELRGQRRIVGINAQWPARRFWYRWVLGMQKVQLLNRLTPERNFCGFARLVSLRPIS